MVRQAPSVAIATGPYGVSFGALSVASGLSILQTVAALRMRAPFIVVVILAAATAALLRGLAGWS